MAVAKHSSKVMIENTKTTKSAEVTSSASMNIKGDVAYVKVDSSGQLTVDGSLIGAPDLGNVTSSGSLKIGAIESDDSSTQLTASSNGTVVATSCEKVKTEGSGGSCTVGTQPSVNSVVIISTSYLASDTKYCSGFWDAPDDPNSSTRLATNVMTWILFNIVALMV